MPTSEEPANWRIGDAWNNLIVVDRKPAARQYIRASELGKPYLERYLAMKGVTPSNPFPPRIQRVFACGNIFEHIIETVFRSLGILVDGQAEVRVDEVGFLPVIGHYDHKVGGQIDLAHAKKILDKELFESIIKRIREIDEDMADFIQFLFPGDWFRERAMAIALNMAEKYPNGLKILIAEIKTVNSNAFWRHKNIDPDTGFFKGYKNHKLQLYTYLKGTGEKEGRRFYISKDDLTIMESVLFSDNKEIGDFWRADIAAMSDYIQNNKEPERPRDFIFNSEKGMWEYNWEVGGSTYLTLMTGAKNEEEWRRSLREEFRKLNSAECSGCGKVFSLTTLNKNKGFCARCTKKPLDTKGGEINE